jgi:hypothetical protein
MKMNVAASFFASSSWNFKPTHLLMVSSNLSTTSVLSAGLLAVKYARTDVATPLQSSFQSSKCVLCDFGHQPEALREFGRPCKFLLVCRRQVLADHHVHVIDQI